MSKPFVMIIAERAKKDPARVVRETLARIERWKNLSGDTKVSLDEVAWLGGVLYLAGIEVGKMNEIVPHTHKFENGVHTVVAEDSTVVADFAGGKRG